MADFDWKKLIAGLAPTLGTALGGPLAGMAIKVIADKVLGNPNATESDVAQALQNGQLTGEQIVALRTADQAFSTRMRELDIDVMKINQAGDEAYLHDIQDARARQIATKDHMPEIIFGIFVAVYVIEVVMFYFGKMPEDEFVRALMTRAFGTVEGGLVGAVAYFIGSSRGSKQSADVMRKIVSDGPK